MNAIYAGSFDPFTNGHLDVIKQASPLFDRIYIVIAENSKKHRDYNANSMLISMKKSLSDVHILNVEFMETDTLVADLAKSLDCEYLIRGIRNPNDYSYEENLAKANWEINQDLKTIYFRATNDVISSTFVKELLRFGKDISKYVPRNILEDVISNEY